MVGGPSIVFTRKAVVDETFNRDSSNFCKSDVRKDATQLYLFIMCQAMPAGLYVTWELDSNSGLFKPRQNKTRSFENMVTSFFQRVRPQCKVESFYTTSTQKKMMHSVLIAFLDTATLCLKPWDANISIAFVKKLIFLSMR